ncbi:hypothetical protein [Roseovarius sp. ZX-A-9]|uniref:hypothetical protein n=1 Tax=Roseovarius sp. ZX-A-9 TaxID=3014783 RepID=UPI00232E485B|nr:hypothetical protein [Roseovarius sp. ZX-A-9]
MSREEYLNRCHALAEEALDAGDASFGSVLVDVFDKELREASNLIHTGDATQHPEFELARWAAQHMDDDARRAASVYTSAIIAGCVPPRMA